MALLNKFTLGILTGLSIGLLVAPDKGEATRKKLSGTAQSLKNKFDELFGEGDEDFQELKSSLEDKTIEFTDELRKKLLKFINKSEKIIRSAQNDV